jgi:hypothetical protein
MAGESLVVHMEYKATENGQSLRQTLHGKINNEGNIQYTTLGRGGKTEVLTSLQFVTEIEEHPTQSSGERKIILGEGIIFKYNGILFKNTQGTITMESMGFNDKMETTVLTPKQSIGGIMPVTVFEAGAKQEFKIL